MNERQRVVAEALLALRLRRLIRVDEELYCDPGYITHAEYQLFLDEKRAAGEYFQPDHWPGYTFPKGQGQLPVVGVRPADAVAFCEWLTQHDQTADTGGWRYRLPQQGEMARYGFYITEAPETLSGYWVHTDTSFVLESIGESAPVLSSTEFRRCLENDLSQERNRFVEYGVGRDFNRILDKIQHICDFVCSYILELARTLDLAFDRKGVRDLSYTLAHALHRQQEIQLADLFSSNPNHDLDDDSTSDSEHDSCLALAHTYTRDLISSLVCDVDHILAHDFDLALTHARSLGLDFYFYGLGSFERNPFMLLCNYIRLILLLTANLLHERDDDIWGEKIDLLLNLYVDFAILKERFEGRLPAFEGIRIVKERVKEE